MELSKIAIIYFSATSNTEKIASIIGSNFQSKKMKQIY